MHEPTEKSAPRRKNPGLWASAVGVVVGLVVLLALPALAPSAAAAPSAHGLTPAVQSASQQWAYGGTNSITADITVTSNGTSYEYQFHEFFGWTVIITQTNTSASTFMLELQRTAVASAFANVCTPTCAHPAYTANYTLHATEQTTAFANFTLGGSVVMNGLSVPALAIENAQAYRQATLSADLTVKGPNGATLYYRTLTASGTAQAQLTLTPPLGLIPLNVAVGDVWTSNASYTFTGSYALQVTWNVNGNSGSASPTGTINEAGNVSLVGADVGAAVHVNDPGANRIVLVITGPFEERDGIILLPHEGDALSGNWADFGQAATTPGLATSESTAEVDYDAHASHFGLVAALSAFQENNPGPVPMVLVGGGLQPAVTQPPSSPSGSVQAQPMSVSAAQALSNTLLGLGQKVSSGWVGILAVALGVGLVGLIVGLVAVQRSRRPKSPPPVRVPPILAGPSPPPGVVAEPAPPPPAPQPPSDPLGHLW